MTDELDTEPEADERPATLGDTLREVYEELEADAAETDSEAIRDQGTSSQEPAQSSDVSEAARTLARSKAKKRRTTVNLQPGAPAQAEAFPETEGQTPGTDEQVGAHSSRKLDPPIGWPVADKEEFNRLPDVAKAQALDFWNRMDTRFTQGTQELARHRQRYQQLDELMDYYVPRWNIAGMTGQQVAAELFATHDLFTKDPLEAAHRLLNNVGITPEQIHAYRQQGGAEGQYGPQGQSQPTYQVDPRVDEIYNWLQSSRQSQEQQHLQAGVSQVEAVRNERTGDGRYLYPELWNDTYLLERVQPLVSSVLKTQPGVSLGEATKRAVHTLRMLDGTANGSPSQNGSGLSAQEIANVRNASASVRGRGNAGIPTVTAAQPGEKMRDSLEAVWQQLSNSH
jgi:hypothetical protein